MLSFFKKLLLLMASKNRQPSWPMISMLLLSLCHSWPYSDDDCDRKELESNSHSFRQLVFSISSVNMCVVCFAFDYFFYILEKQP